MIKKISLMLIVIAVVAGAVTLYLSNMTVKRINYILTPNVVADKSEWKTYTSKYGFSLLYPKGWILKEETDVRSPKEGVFGDRPFDIYNYSADEPKNEPGVSINCSYYVDATTDIEERSMPKDPFERALYICSKNNLYEKKPGDKIENMKSNGANIVSVYFDGKRLVQAFLYLPKKDVIVGFTLNSEHGGEEFYNILKTIRTEHEKWKTYVSKYGFSIIYPNTWSLAEEEYGLGRGLEHGKVPFSMNDGKNDLYLSYESINLDNKYADMGYMRRYVGNMNLLSEIYEINKYEGPGATMLLFKGKSIRNPGRPFYLALIYIDKTKILISIEEEIYVDPKAFENIFRMIKIK